MTIAEARTQLEGVGFLVEYTDDNASMYVRKTPNGIAWRLYLKGHQVSDRAVNTLLNKKAGMQ